MLKKILIVVGVIAVIGGSYAAYLWFQPHRDVQSAKVDVTTTVKALFDEYKKNAEAANKKYLSSDGESKIFAISGKISDISENSSEAKVITLKQDGADAGVSCTFTAKASQDEATKKLKVGDQITIKGAITSGPSYDADLEEYTDATMLDCAVNPAKK